MPHIIVEYSNAIDASMPAALEHAHDALTAQGIDKARIKTRGIALPHAIVGDKGFDGKMAHITLLLLEGRDIPTKKQYGDAIIEQVKNNLPSDTTVTMEIRDMVKDTYYL